MKNQGLRLFKLLSFILLAFGLQGCGYLKGSISELFGDSNQTSISGSFSILQGMSTSDFQAASCTTYQAHLYKVTLNGTRVEPAIQSVDVEDDGKYSFVGVDKLGIDLNSADALKSYVVVIDGCSESYQRVLSASTDQTVSPATDVLSLSYSILGRHSMMVSSVVSTGVGQINQKAESVSDKNRYDSFVALKNDGPTSAQFLSTFGFSIDELGYVIPQVSVAGSTTSVDEGLPLVLDVTRQHWNTDYIPEYQWLLDATIISSSEDLNYSLGKNLQGARTLRLRIGKQAALGVMDVARPIYERIWNLSVNNNHPAVAPSLTLTSAAFSNSLLASVNINTGVAYANCETFSEMILTESSIVPPVLWTGSFSCSSTPNQAASLTVSGADGLKTVALWSRDSAGNVSVSPTFVTFVLDTQGPTLSLDSLTGGQTIAGGSPANVLYTATDSNLVANPISILASSDSGATYSAIASNLANTGIYSWLTPSVNSPNYRIRVVATDKAGNQATVSSSSNFTVSTSLPNLTQTLVPAIHKGNSGSLTVTYGGACEDGILIGLSIDGSPQASLACAGSAWTYTTSAMTADGTRVYEFSQNNGLTRTVQATLIRDTVLPGISSLLLANGIASTSSRFLNLEFSAADGTGTIESKVSHICPKTYISSGAAPAAPSNVNDTCWISLANAGISLANSYTNVTLPNYFFNAFVTDNHTVRAWVRDEAGNISTSFAEDGLLFNTPIATTLSNLTASKSDSSPIPLPRADLDVPLNQTVFIKWKALAGSTPITSNSIRLFYNTTALETATNWIEIDNGVSKLNAANSGCSIDANYSGCYAWTNTVGPTPLRFKVQITDSSNVTSAGETNRINTGNYNVLVGNMGVGVGGVGSQFSFVKISDGHKMVTVSEDGIVYALIRGVGLIRILPTTSQVELIVPETGTDVDGPVGTATMRTIWKPWTQIDNQGRLYFIAGTQYAFELGDAGGKLRRFNPATNTVELLLNDSAGSSRADGVLGTNFKPGVQLPHSLSLAPNGDFYFADRSTNSLPANVKLWKLSASTGIVNEIPMPNLTSVNAYAQPNQNWMTGQNITAINTRSAQWFFNSDSSIRFFLLRSDTGSNAIPAPCPVFDGNYQNLSQPQSFHIGNFADRVFQGRDLNLYMSRSHTDISAVNMSNFAAAPSVKINKSSDFLPIDGSVANVASSGKAGNYEITAAGRIYFVELGLLRFVDESGLIRTYTGQTLNGGHNVNSINVRLGGVIGIHKSNQGLLVIEPSERIMEHRFADSKIYVRAGNSQSITTNLALNADQTGMKLSWSGGEYGRGIAYDPVTDSIFTTARISSLASRTATVQISPTGVITRVVGGDIQTPANAYPNVAEGFSGLNLTTTGTLDSAGLNAGVVGFDFDSRKLLLGMTASAGGVARHAMFKHYDLTDQKIYHFAGVNSGTGPTYTLGINTVNFSADGTTISGSEVPQGYSSYNMTISPQYDPDNPMLNGGPRYIFSASTNGRMVSMPVDNTKTVQTMAANFASTQNAFARKGGLSFVYRCWGGLLQRAPLAVESPATVLSFTTLPLPSGATCDGGFTGNGAMYYDQSRQSIIFPVRQNASFGVAEYYDP